MKKRKGEGKRGQNPCSKEKKEATNDQQRKNTNKLPLPQTNKGESRGVLRHQGGSGLVGSGGVVQGGGRTKGLTSEKLHECRSGRLSGNQPGGLSLQCLKKGGEQTREAPRIQCPGPFLSKPKAIHARQGRTRESKRLRRREDLARYPSEGGQMCRVVWAKPSRPQRGNNGSQGKVWGAPKGGEGKAAR